MNLSFLGSKSRRRRAKKYDILVISRGETVDFGSIFRSNPVNKNLPLFNATPEIPLIVDFATPDLGTTQTIVVFLLIQVLQLLQGIKRLISDFRL